MPEVSFSRKDHRHPQAIRGSDGFFVAQRAARLDDRGHARDQIGREIASAVRAP